MREMGLTQVKEMATKGKTTASTSSRKKRENFSQ